jgi:hypothetical protein
MHLRRILQSYARYYNEIRTHRSLDKDAPVTRPVQRVGVISSRAVLGGTADVWGASGRGAVSGPQSFLEPLGPC